MPMQQTIPPPVGIDLQPLEVSDFSGGVTDYYLGGSLNKSKTIDNLLVIRHGDVGKLFTRQGSQILDSTYTQIPAGNQRIGTLKYFEATLFIQSKEKIQYINSGWQTLTGPTGNQAFPSTAATTDVLSIAYWNRHLLVTSSAFSRVQKIYATGTANGAVSMRTAGLPALASSPTATPTAGANTYLYAFVYWNTYTVDTVIYEDFGPVTEITCAAAVAPNVSSIALAAIPVVANGATDNYDTTNMKVKIYRTTNGGATFYYVGQVTNGTTTYSDTSSDATIQAANILLYTEGGVLGNDPPPLCKLVHVVGDTAYYGHIKDTTGEVLQSTLAQSVPGDIDAVPADNTVEVDEALIGLSSVKDTPIMLCDKGAVYRVDGQYDELGRGGMVATKISNRTDCVSSQSVVQTLDGVFWAGTDGIYFTDGYSVLKLNQDYDKTWATWVATATQRSRIKGHYDSKKNRIWWTIQSTTGVSDDCDKCYILDLNWGIKPNACFTTVSNGVNFAPTALEFSGATMIRADSRGYIFSHADTLYADPKVDISTAVANWQTAYIPYNWTSAGFDFGTTSQRKFVPRVDVTAKNETNLSLQIVSLNDDNAATYDLKPIRYRGDVTWGDPDVIWGDPSLVWDSEGIIDEERNFPARTHRCQYKQVRLQAAYVPIVNSDLLGTATVDATAKTATLDSGSLTWPSQVVDYYIALSNDGYLKEYLITQRTSDTVLTFQDTTGAAPNTAGLTWVIRGYPRNEVLNLITVVLHYTLLGRNQKRFTSASSGEVGS